MCKILNIERDTAYRAFETYLITFIDYLMGLALLRTYQENPNQQLRAVGHTNLENVIKRMGTQPENAHTGTCCAQFHTVTQTWRSSPEARVQTSNLCS